MDARKNGSEEVKVLYEDLEKKELKEKNGEFEHLGRELERKKNQDLKPMRDETELRDMENRLERLHREGMEKDQTISGLRKEMKSGHERHQQKKVRIKNLKKVLREYRGRPGNS